VRVARVECVRGRWAQLGGTGCRHVVATAARTCRVRWALGLWTGLRLGIGVRVRVGVWARVRARAEVNVRLGVRVMIRG
jgi:hypothetical protein